MSKPLERFYAEMNMRVVRLTESEAAAANHRFEALVAEAEAAGRFNEPGPLQLHKQLFALAHFGADALTQVAEGTALEALPTR